MRAGVLKGYMKTLSSVYLIGVPSSFVALGGALYMRNIKMDMSHGKPAGGPPAKTDVESAAGAEAGEGKVVPEGEAPGPEASENLAQKESRTTVGGSVEAEKVGEKVEA